jgi:hypothetical protein
MAQERGCRQGDTVKPCTTMPQPKSTSATAPPLRYSGVARRVLTMANRAEAMHLEPAGALTLSSFQQRRGSAMMTSGRCPRARRGVPR